MRGEYGLMLACSDKVLRMRLKSLFAEVMVSNPGFSPSLAGAELPWSR